jgi:hypothetical protein
MRTDEVFANPSLVSDSALARPLGAPFADPTSECPIAAPLTPDAPAPLRASLRRRSGPPRDAPPAELKAAALRRDPLAGLADATYGSLARSLTEDRDADAAGAVKDVTPDIAAAMRQLGRLPTVAAAIAHVERARATERKDVTFRGMQAAFADERASIDEDIRLYDRETVQIMAAISDIHGGRHRELKEEHRQQVQDLVTDWKSVKKARKYNHASNELIARRKQFEYFINAGEYGEARLCAEQLRVAEEKEAKVAMESMKRDFKGSKRLMETKQAHQTAELGFGLDTEGGVVLNRRRVQRLVLENVEKKVLAKGERHREPEKAWNLTRMARMTDISKKIQPQPVVVPKGDREGIRARGRFEGQTVPIKLPPLDFEHL